MNLLTGNLHAAVFKLASTRGVDTRLALRRIAFEPINPKGDDERAAGAVEFERTDATEFSKGAMQFGPYVLFQWRIDRLKVPSPALRKALLEWCQQFEAKNGRAPGRAERAEQKVALKQLLRAKQEPVTKVHPVAIDGATCRVFVFSSSASVIDEVQAALESALDVRLVSSAAARLASTKEKTVATPTMPMGTDDARMMLDHGALGRACMTWLVHRSESTAPIIDSDGPGAAPVVSFFGKAALCGVAGEVATVKVTGTTAPYAKLVKQALSKGLMFDSARLKLAVGEQEFAVTLDASTFTLRSVKLPPALLPDPHEKLLERLSLVGELATLVDRLVGAFIEDRLSARWPKTVAEMLAWMGGES